MIEIVKELAGVLKDLPDMAVYIMVGILFYKVFIIGGTLTLVKYTIAKLHDYLTLRNENAAKPSEVVKTYDLDGRFIKTDGTLGLFNQLLDEMQTGVNIDSKYIHKSDVQFLLAAIREKRARENP